MGFKKPTFDLIFLGRARGHLAKNKRRRNRKSLIFFGNKKGEQGGPRGTSGGDQVGQKWQNGGQGTLLHRKEANGPLPFGGIK